MGVNLPNIQLGMVEPLGFGFGGSYSCAVFADDNVRCWGFGNDGQLGLGKQAVLGDLPGEMGANLTPVDLDGPAVEIAASCARLLDGGVKCWGIGARGALGNGSVEDIGDEPGEMGADLPPIDLGPGRTALQLERNHHRQRSRRRNRRLRLWLSLRVRHAAGAGPVRPGAAAST